MATIAPPAHHVAVTPTDRGHAPGGHPAEDAHSVDESAVASPAGHGGEELGTKLPLWSTIPFVGILLSIAIFPLFAPRWWHKHFPQVSLFWALVMVVPFLFAYRRVALHEILHIYMLDYLPFVILLWSLYTVSAGIYIRGTLRGSPSLNTLLLVIGTILASWVGTTGASMILIRPLIRANAWRRHKVHLIVFFIFLVSNIGGSLTPLGDPPLFLGFLRGVPFFWTLKLIGPLLVVAVPLLITFFVIDLHYFRQEERPEQTGNEPVRIEGARNFILLGGIVGAVLMSGMWKAGTFDLFGVPLKIEFVVRDFLLLLMGLLSLRVTSAKIHKANEFSWFPIREVAILFAGIFMTIIPALAILKAGADGALAPLIAFTREPSHFFWITGGLSGFLDNAPTYLTFLNTAMGSFFEGVPVHEAVHHLIREQSIYLEAISSGAVYMGALTYIGNAPNFMVKSIAEEAGIAMPSFFGYMVRWSLPILIPAFILLTVVFYM